MSLYAIKARGVRRQRDQEGDFFLGLLVATVLSFPFWLALLLVVL